MPDTVSTHRWCLSPSSRVIPDEKPLAANIAPGHPQMYTAGSMLNVEDWIKRADEVDASINHWNYEEGVQFTTSMIAAFYGPDSPQMKVFREGVQNDRGSGVILERLVKGTLRSLKGEIQAGLIRNVRALLTGEIVSELLVLAREVLSDQSEGSMKVSSVLVAAAFEDIIRRMGAEFAGVTARPKLEEVITSLKQKDALKGGEVTTALGYLKFRNDSLHADWAKVERTQVASCLTFVEALLVKHFS